MSAKMPTLLCLASGSAIRRQLLEAAGIAFTVDPADIDEEALDEPRPSYRALELARRKAAAVASRRPGELVLGADQVLNIGGKLGGKPRDRAEAAASLAKLSGRSHAFHCGVCLVRDERTVFETVETAIVTFHELSGAEIEAYVATGEGIGCAGAYRLEGGGMRLIRSIHGDHFTVLGLPMLPLLAALRREGFLAGHGWHAGAAPGAA